MSVLPDERRLWQFFEGVKGWRFSGTGYMVRGPGEGDDPMESSRLPLYVAERPSLMAEYARWDQERPRPPGQSSAAGKGEPKGNKADAAAQRGRPENNKDREKDKPIPPPEAQQQLEEAGAPSLSHETPSPSPSSSSSRPSSTATGKSGGAAEDVAWGDGQGTAAMGPSLKANAQPASSSPPPPPSAAPAAATATATAASDAVAAASSSTAAIPGSPLKKPQAQALVTGRGAPQAERGGQEEVGAQPRTGGGGGGEAVGSGAAPAEAAAAARPGVVEGIPETGGKGAAQGGKGADQAKEAAAVVAETATATRGAGRGKEQAASGAPPMGEGHSAAAESEAADGGGKAAGVGKCGPRPAQGLAAGPCLCPRDAEGDSLHKTVNVERRCWPGSNKPGGVARIVKKYTVEEEICGEAVENTYYDVKYLLGGSEKRVKETFISCTPNETEARQAAPREIFTVEVPEPTRRQRSAPPKLAPARTSPLSSSVDANSSAASSASAKAKAKTVKDTAAAKKLAKAKRSEPATARGDGGVDARADKKSKKRARAAEGGMEGGAKRRDGGGGKKAWSSSKASKENELEVPEPKKERHAITDLSVVAEVQKAPAAPLSPGRMGAFQQALRSLFDKSSADTISVTRLEADINAQRPPEATPFDAVETKKALEYLEDVESKVMVDGGMLYRI
eukprot:g17723.t1